MTDIAIRVENLGKQYHIGALQKNGGHYNYKSLRDSLAHTAGLPLRAVRGVFSGNGHRREPAEDTIWALKDVSFEVRQGEIVGVIGRNGAGKSTLLKLLSRITEPTTGRAEIYGRIGSLLEVGTGFHPELTGRDNVFLNGAILGMKRAEIARQFDEIVAFAEVEKFIDTPVKHYSSGMYLRLAFAVAAHLEPEILIVDEVLAVGDVTFQKKCLGKMQDVSRGGRTVLFVSHNMTAILQLTSRTIVLSGGKSKFDGPTDKAIALCSGSIQNASVTLYDVEHERRTYSGTGAARIIALWFDRPTPVFSPTEDLQFCVRVRADESVSKLRASMTVFATDGMPVGSSIGPEFTRLIGHDQFDIRVRLPHPSLAPGQYYCGVSIGRGSHTSRHVDYDVVLDVLSFEVVPEEGDAGTLSNWGRDWGRIRFQPLSQALLPEVLAQRSKI
jgi:lipopolysaccharide transport system ATP-binding protein